MKYFDWDPDKNEWLKRERNLCFEDFLDAYMEKRVLNIIPHRNKERYKNQRVFIVAIEKYVYMVPFVEDEKKIFLKTIIPSRKLTRKYLIDTP